jgi:hypothetical protein
MFFARLIDCDGLKRGCLVSCITSPGLISTTSVEFKRIFAMQILNFIIMGKNFSA